VHTPQLTSTIQHCTPLACAQRAVQRLAVGCKHTRLQQRVQPKAGDAVGSARLTPSQTESHDRAWQQCVVGERHHYKCDPVPPQFTPSLLKSVEHPSLCLGRPACGLWWALCLHTGLHHWYACTGSTKSMHLQTFRQSQSEARTRQLRNCAASKGVRKPSVPMAKHITGGSGESSANRLARCLQVSSWGEVGHTQGVVVPVS
jgi:hypothetical protein